MGVIIGGLGAGRVSLSDELLVQIVNARVVVFRTLRHPGVEALAQEVASRGIEVLSMDRLYENGATFGEVYSAIVDSIGQLAEEAAPRDVVYLVPGSPFVAESTVQLLRQRGIVSSVFGAPSFLEYVWDVLGRDPGDGMTIIDATELLDNPSRASGPTLIVQAHSVPIVEELAAHVAQQKNRSLTLLSRLGTEDQAVIRTDAEALPPDARIDHLTTVFVEDWESPSESLGRFWEIIRTLRTRCPWDAEQTHESLGKHLIEEAYETLEAIEEVSIATDDDAYDRAMLHLKEELGDLLIQVFFHANLARETDAFSLGDVAEFTTEKLIRRHPHVFGDMEVRHAEEVVRNWEAIKLEEQSRRSVLEGIPRALPDGARYVKLARKLRSLGPRDESDPPYQGSLSADDAIAIALHAASRETLEGIIEECLKEGISRKLEIDPVIQRVNRWMTEAILAREAATPRALIEGGDS
ncbi:MAG: MazG nucleotide pyrophosphohydrolase domain-containing protein [Acidimicrobiales bacterium]